MIEIKKEDVKVDVKRVEGEDPRYDTWSIVARAWSDETEEKTVTLNVLKGNGNFSGGTDAPIYDKLKEKYLREVEEFEAEKIQKEEILDHSEV